MTSKFSLNGCICTLTIARVRTTNVVSDQSRPAFVQSHFQSQARLMCVTTLEMDNLYCTKNGGDISYRGGGVGSLSSPNFMMGRHKI